MSRCDLEIVLERPDGRYTAGERVSGFVNVRVNADCRCNGLDVWVGWRTHGKGNRRDGIYRRVQLFSGEWKAGEEHLHPFDLEIPADASPTYTGTYLNVDWGVHATADIPWAFDPTAMAPMDVTPAPDGAHDPGPLFDVVRQAPTGSTNGMLFFAILWLAFCVPILGTMTFITLTDGPSGGELWFMMAFIGLFDVVFIGLGLFLLFKAIGTRVAERRLGPVVVEVPTGPLRGGDTVPVRVAFTPSAAITAAVEVTLRGKEQVVSGSGTNKTTHTHVLYTRDETLRAHGPMPQGAAVALDASLALPAGAPASFEADDNALRWEVEVRVAIDGWPDWSRVNVLHVAPARAA